MVFRVYVEKKEELAQEARQLRYDIRHLLMIRKLERLRLIQRYDVEGIDGELFERACRQVLSEPQLDTCSGQLEADEAHTFAVEYLPGQYDQRADSAAQCIQILSQGERPTVRTARVYKLYGDLSEDELTQIKKYLINPVEAREASLDKPESLSMQYELPGSVAVLEGFCALDEAGLSAFLQAQGLAMDMDDLRFCQQYFRQEGREPSITEIKMIDTYWSDHCRHTSFLTSIDSVQFADERLSRAWARYQKLREGLKRTRPVNLMDLATIAAKELKRQGRLERLDESEEINACTVKFTLNHDGKPEDWLLLFKNETHNHPTEIEPFGGAATCIGGAIRDPLSGRAYVYAAMRVSGAADPTVPVRDTMPGKLPQRKLVTTAAAGYSSYGNQIGLATGLVDELYHPGYAAKRMEIGAVIAAAPAANVRREVPAPGDAVILLGGRTGRDGCGGATGSSKAHKLDSLESCGAEVQKGNAPEERKLQRLFRNPEAAALIKRCNDFGAGGVSVAIGELADGLCIQLDAVPKKYEGLDGTELAISESQERMAVVLAPEDVERFCALAAAENLETSRVAEVTEAKRLCMYWQGHKIVDLSREFLNSNGAEKHIDVVASAQEPSQPGAGGDFAQLMYGLAEDLNVCSKRGLSERFDSTIGAGTVWMPFGGRRQRTPIQAMAHKVSLEHGDTDTCSLMAYGFNPFISEQSPYHGAYLAVVESVARLMAGGASYQEIYLSFQEYFAKPGREPERWGQPLAALLGALEAQLDLGVAAIGGKDSMSGSFEGLDVPPTLVSFAVTTDSRARLLSPEYKAAGNRVLWLKPAVQPDAPLLPKPESLKCLFACMQRLSERGVLASAYTLGYGGAAEAVLKQCMGNGFGFRFDDSLSPEQLRAYAYGSFLAELPEDSAEQLTAELGSDTALKAAGIQLQLLGEVTEKPVLRLGETALELSALEEVYEQRLEKVFSCNSLPDGASEQTADIPLYADTEAAQSTEAPQATEVPHAPGLVQGRPRVLIPVFPGTNCEYDTARAAEEAGLKPQLLIVRNLSAADISASVRAAAEAIAQAQLVFIPGGFSGGDEPEGSAKFITSFFRNERVREAVSGLLDERGGLMAGICNGFQALIKLGLVPYGRITDPDAAAPTLSYNTIGRHQSKIVTTRVISKLSPWLAEAELGGCYQVPISHGEGRFICEPELMAELIRRGQIATQYVDASGHASMQLQDNPNGSMYAVEGITSPDGRIFGKMGHSERNGSGLYGNVPGRYELGMFRAAYRYFK